MPGAGAVSSGGLPARLPGVGHPRTTHLTSTPVPRQKESAGFLPASLPVWLLLCLRLQAHELCPVVPAQWQVHRAGAGARPEQHLHHVRAAQHRSHQAECPPRQLELRRYTVGPVPGGRGPGAGRASSGLDQTVAEDLEHRGGSHCLVTWASPLFSSITRCFVCPAHGFTVPLQWDDG